MPPRRSARVKNTGGESETQQAMRILIETQESQYEQTKFLKKQHKEQKELLKRLCSSMDTLKAILDKVQITAPPANPQQAASIDIKDQQDEMGWNSRLPE